MDPTELLGSVGGAGATLLALGEGFRRWRGRRTDERREVVEVQGLELENLAKLQEVWDKQFAQMQAQMDDVVATVSAVRGERDLALRERDEARQQRDAFHSEIQSLRGEVSDLRSEVARLRAQT